MATKKKPKGTSSTGPHKTKSGRKKSAKKSAKKLAKAAAAGSPKQAVGKPQPAAEAPLRELA